MSDNNPGAGGKGSAGYWGYSSDEAREERFERLYRLRIPKNRYKTTTHNPLTCGKCTNAARTIHLCNVTGRLGFGELPRETVHAGNRQIERCPYCKAVLSNVKTPGKPKTNKGEKNE